MTKPDTLIGQGAGCAYQSGRSRWRYSAAFRKASLRLEVTPQIPLGQHHLGQTSQQRTAWGSPTAAGFAIHLKHVKTQVLVENGSAVVIGGIFELNGADE